MKQIPLTKGKIAIVDDDMYDYLNQWNWCAMENQWQCYAVRRENGKTIFMRRVIMNAPVDMEVDHRNNDGLFNLRSNLRICTRSQNFANKGKLSTNKSGYKGVSWNKKDKKYVAMLRAEGQSFFLGCFADPIEAAKARELHGEFAKLNFEG